jgi:hypothetical protein
MEPQTEKKQIVSISHSKNNSMAFAPLVRATGLESDYENLTDKSMPLNIHVGGKLYPDSQVSQKIAAY